LKKKIPLIKELNNDEKPTIHLPEPLEDFLPEKILPKDLLRESLPIPQISEIEVVRHFTKSIPYGIWS